MAIVFVGAATAAKVGDTSGTTSIALNTGLTGGSRDHVEEGDLVVAVYAVGGAYGNDITLAITDPAASNYPTLVGERYNDVAIGNGINLRIGGKFMGSTPDASVSFGPTQNNQWAGATAVYVLSGVDPSTPQDVTATVADNDNTARPNPPSITPVTTGAKVLAIGAGVGVTSSNFTSSDLTSFVTLNSPDSYDATIGIGYVNWTSGAINPAQFGGGSNQTADAATAVSIALRPITAIPVTPANGAHAHAATSPSIAPNSVLAPANAAHGSSSTGPSLTPHSTVTPANAAHGHTATQPVLTISGINVDSAQHDHQASQPSIAWRGTISPGSASHGHQATSPALAVHYTLTINSAAHAHLATSPNVFRGVITPSGRRFRVAASTSAMRRFQVAPSTSAMRRFKLEG